MAALLFLSALLAMTSFNAVTVMGQYRHLGCFADTSNRAIKNARGESKEISQYWFPTADSSIRLCNFYTYKLGYKVFGVEAGGECWTSPSASLATANETYAKYGPAPHCSGGKGGNWANDVYVVEAYNRHKHVGCFYDKPERAMPQKPVDGRFMKGKDKVNLCYLDAVKLDYTVFAVQYGGQCFSGPSAAQTYRKYGKSSSCVDGTGGSWSNDIYLIYKPYRHLGCFADSSSDRTMPSELANYQGPQNADAVRLCYLDSKTRGYEMFGVQDNGKCWSGQNVASTYKKHGSSNACSGGKGGGLANDVYTIDATHGCPAGWMEDSETCFKAFEGTKDWWEAKVMCIAEKASLVKIPELRYQEFVQRFLLNGNVTKTFFWIGLSNLDVDKFRWTDNEDSVFFRWRNESNVEVKGANCVTIERSSGLWKVEPCSNRHGYVCSKPAAVGGTAHLKATLGVGISAALVMVWFALDTLHGSLGFDE